MVPSCYSEELSQGRMDIRSQYLVLACEQLDVVVDTYKHPSQSRGFFNSERLEGRSLLSSFIPLDSSMHLTGRWSMLGHIWPNVNVVQSLRKG